MRAAPQSRSHADSFRPPLMSLAYSGVWLYGSQQLYYLGQNGWEWGTLAAVATTGISLSLVATAMNDGFKQHIHHKKLKAYKKKLQQIAKSRFAILQDIEDSPILNHKQGICLGSIKAGRRNYKDIFYDAEYSLSLIAPAGEMKSMTVLASTLFGNLNQSVIVNDPSGELYSICGPALLRQGYEVRVLTPFADKVRQLIGQPVKDVGLDLFSAINDDTPLYLIRPLLQKIALWVMPGTPGMSEKDQFFFREGRKLFVFLAMYELVHGRIPTLSAMRKHLMLGPGRLYEFFLEAEDKSDFDGVYAELAQSLSGVLSAAPQQFAGGFSVAEQHLDPFDHASALGQHSQSSQWNPHLLKHPRKKTALFVIYTLEMMETYTAALSTTMNYLFDTIASDNQKGKVTALLDEAGMLKFPLADKLDFYRRFGLRVLMVWQDIAQAEANHGKTGMRRILAASRLKLFMGLQEPEMLEMVSKLSGTTAMSEMSLNDRANMASPLPDLSPSLQGKDRPLLRPEDVRMIERDQLLVVGDRLQPMQLKKLPWWTRSKWKKIAGPSPFYRE